MQSRIHGLWVRLTSSTLEDRQGYRPSDCFETFPFRPEPELAPGTALDAAAEALFERRAAFMVQRDLGLTKTYNALKNPEDDDPEVVALRELHEALDREVLRAYGHPEIGVRGGHGGGAREVRGCGAGYAVRGE